MTLLIKPYHKPNGKYTVASIEWQVYSGPKPKHTFYVDLATSLRSWEIHAPQKEVCFYGLRIFFLMFFLVLVALASGIGSGTGSGTGSGSGSGTGSGTGSMTGAAATAGKSFGRCIQPWNQTHFPMVHSRAPANWSR